MVAPLNFWNIQKMSIGERIKEVRGSLSRDDFATMIGVTRNTVQRYEIYGRKPTVEFIESICEKFDVRSDWLLFGTLPKHKSDKKNDVISGEPKSEFGYIPMVEAKLSAGEGAFVESEDVQVYYAFRKEWLRKVATSIKDLVLMRVVGDSMYPTIQQKDTVMVDTSRRDIKEGDIYAIRYDSTVLIKRLAQRPGGKVQIISDNKTEFESYEISEEELHIIGQVIFFSRVMIQEGSFA